MSTVHKSANKASYQKSGGWKRNYIRCHDANWERFGGTDIQENGDNIKFMGATSTFLRDRRIPAIFGAYI